MTPPLADLFRHNLWANMRLLDACAPLADTHLDAAAPGTYGRVRDTLLHTFASEERYARELTKAARDDLLAEGMLFPGFAVLRERATASGEALVEIAEKLAPGQRIQGVYRGAPYDLPATVLLTQAINHATEHRAHIVTILSARGVETPRLDAIGYAMEGSR